MKETKYIPQAECQAGEIVEPERVVPRVEPTYPKLVCGTVDLKPYDKLDRVLSFSFVRQLFGQRGGRITPYGCF